MVRDGPPSSALDELRAIQGESGLRGLFRGVAPRTAWMGLAGLIFLGSYEYAKAAVHASLAPDGDARAADETRRRTLPPPGGGRGF